MTDSGVCMRTQFQHAHGTWSISAWKAACILVRLVHLEVASLATLYQLPKSMDVKEDSFNKAELGVERQDECKGIAEGEAKMGLLSN